MKCIGVVRGQLTGFRANSGRGRTVSKAVLETFEHTTESLDHLMGPERYALRRRVFQPPAAGAPVRW